VVEIDPLTHKTTTLWSAPISTDAGDARIAVSARGDRAAAVVQDFEHAPEISIASIAKLGFASRVTQENRALTPIGSARSLEWTSEGHAVQGWLVAPLNLAAGKTYPMVVTIHGGPSAATTPIFPRVGARGGVIRELLAHGYFVFLPNPRGSYGQGEAFTRANIRDFGGGDLRDILAGVDAVEKVAPVDDQRLGVYGHSYGGFMTMWTVTHSNRFHAAVSGAGIANWISYYGENGIDQWMVPFFGASAYDDPAIYRKLSPLDSIRDAKTPTFVYVGEHDVECPSPQSVEFWHGLKAVGVPTKLLILEGEGHGIRKPEHVKQLSDAEMGWLDHYLAAKPGS
jgi:dipeptidyl aminopeptidase/acylaminoacyl peptidase